MHMRSYDCAVSLCPEQLGVKLRLRVNPAAALNGDIENWTKTRGVRCPQCTNKTDNRLREVFFNIGNTIETIFLYANELARAQ